MSPSTPKKYLVIADELRSRVRSGTYQAGVALPAETTLAEEFRVSVPTIRQAVGVLRAEGAIESRHGIGTFVREKPQVKRYGIQRYSRSVWGGDAPKAILTAEGSQQGHSVDQATETGQEPAPSFVANRLPDVEEGELVHTRRRVTRIDGKINQSADSYFSIATGKRGPALVTGEGAGGHIARINAVSPVLEIQEEIATRIPTDTESAHLEIPEGTPVFEVIRTYHTEDGPLDVTRFIIRGDMAVFDYRFPVPE